MPEFPGSLTTYGHAVSDARKSIRGPSTDPVAWRQILRALTWVNWLTAQNKGGPQASCGVIGEIGVLWWQDVAQWAGVMEALYEYYDQSGLSVLAFCATSVEYGISLAQYTSKVWMSDIQGVLAYGKAWEPLNTVGVTADSTEVHSLNLSLPAGGFRGIALCNGVNFTGSTAATLQFSNTRELTQNGYTVTFAVGGSFQNTGTGPWLPYYNYGTSADYAFLAARGMRVVRLCFRWERFQRSLGGALDTTELGYLDTAIAAANAQGIQIILDMHNFGNYYLDNGTTGVRHNVNDGTVTFAHFTDFWTKMSAHYNGVAGIFGYQLMNEPVSVAAADVETMQKNAVAAIRGNGDTTLCLVSGGGSGDWDSIDAGGSGWGSLHATDFMATTDGNRTLTCSLTSGSTTVTVTAGTLTAVDKNRYVTGTNIPAGSQITSVNTGAGTFVMSKAAQATAAGVTVTVRGNYLFVADHYLDFNSSGSYGNSYATEITNSQTAGHLGFGYPLKSLSNISAGPFATSSASLVPIVTTGGTPWSPSLTLVAPLSGFVEFEYSGQFTFTSTTAGDTGSLGIVCTAGGGPNPNTIVVGQVEVNGATHIMSGTWKFTVALTAGNTYTYKPEINVSNVRATLTANGAAGTGGGFIARPVASGQYPGE